MAAAATTLGEMSDILECAVCLETVRNPKTLSCNHSYCKNCLDGLLQFTPKGGAVIKCPKSCETTTNILPYQTTNDLGVDYMLKHIVDVIINKETDDKNTTFNCEGEKECCNKVNGYCESCDHFLCTSCYHDHKETCQHTKPLRSVSFDHKDQQINVQCKQHSTKALHICLNDDTFVCVYCLQREHCGHPYSTLKEQADKLRITLGSELEQIKLRTGKLSMVLKEAEKDVAASRSELQETLKSRKMQSIFDYMEFLNRKEKEVMDEYDLVSNTHVRNCFTVHPELYESLSKKDDLKFLFQKATIAENIKKMRREKTKKRRKIIVSLSNASLNMELPLGEIHFKYVNNNASLDEKKTFQVDFSSKGVDHSIATQLLSAVKDICDDGLSCTKIQNSKSTNSTKKYSWATYIFAFFMFFFAGNFLSFFTGTSKTINRQQTTNNSGIHPTDIAVVHNINENDENKNWSLAFKKKGMDYIENLIESGKNEELRLILKNCPTIFHNRSNKAPFFNQPVHMAARYDNIVFLKELLQHEGSWVKMINNIGSTVFHISAAFSFDCFSWLAQKYPHMIEEKNKYGRTPFHYAAYKNVDVVRFLLSKQVDVFEKDFQGKTALDLAEQYKFNKSKKLLRKAMQNSDL